MYSPIEVVEHVLRLLQEGTRVSTYKPAVLLALIDLSLEKVVVDENAPMQILTRDIAEKVLAYYWDHTSPFNDAVNKSSRILIQCTSHKNDASQAKIVSDIRKYRESFGAGDISRHVARMNDRQGYNRLREKVEMTLIEMPIPKLQRIGKDNRDILYSIRWRDDHANQDSRKVEFQKTEVRKYQLRQSREAEAVYGTVDLLPGVGSTFASLHSLLRPHVIQHWVSDVVRWNDLQHSDVSSDVSGFLFSDYRRTNLAPIRDRIGKLDCHKCFYCGCELTEDLAIDHFVPWSRTHDDGLHNLVSACSDCNLNKSDYLVSPNQLRKWAARIRSRSAELTEIAERSNWEFRPEQALARASNIYSKLPNGILVWDAKKRFVHLDLIEARDSLTA
jgi:5-methylcytosine-specific restriction endonuclease McrA